MKIKFRALKDDMSNCQFVYGNLIYENGIPRIQEDETKILFTTCLKGTEGQFIGITDNTGKEIYNGDHVAIHHPYKNRMFTGFIEWLGYKFGCRDFHFTHFDNPTDIFSEGTQYIKVIGNKHEFKN